MYILYRKVDAGFCLHNLIPFPTHFLLVQGMTSGTKTNDKRQRKGLEIATTDKAAFNWSYAAASSAYLQQRQPN